MSITSIIACSDYVDASKRVIHQDQTPQDWIKYNTNTSKNRVNKTKTNNYVSRDTDHNIVKKDERTIGNIPFLLVKTLGIRYIVDQAIQENYLKDIIESNSLTLSMLLTENLYLLSIFVTYWRISIDQSRKLRILVLYTVEDLSISDR